MNLDFIKKFNNQVFHKIMEIALFRKDLKLNERGRIFFNENPGTLFLIHLNYRLVIIVNWKIFNNFFS